MIAPMPDEFVPDEITVIWRSGVHRISWTIPQDVEPDYDGAAETARHVLWGLRHGMKMPEVATPVERRDVCLACGARPHFQDRRMADPRVEEIVADAERSIGGSA